jgi:hypothetical protein
MRPGKGFRAREANAPQVLLDMDADLYSGGWRPHLDHNLASIG